MVFLFRFDIKGNGLEFILNDRIALDFTNGLNQDLKVKMQPLITNIGNLLMPFRSLSVSPTIITYELLDTKEEEVMLSKGLGIHIPLYIKNEIFRLSRQLAGILEEVMLRHSIIEAEEVIEQDAQYEEELPKNPIIHPIGMLPVISNLIIESYKGAKDNYENLIAAYDRPHVLNDEIINRVNKLYSSDKQFIPIFQNQIAIWEKDKLTYDQKKEIAKLKEVLVEWDKILKGILALNQELSKGTIDKIIAMDDFELGLKVISGEIPGSNYMNNRNFNNLTPEQINIAREIDKKFIELEQRGCDYAVIFVEMSDLMPKFKYLMDELKANDFEQLNLQLIGFYEYGKFLEWVAIQIATGEIIVPK